MTDDDDRPLAQRLRDKANFHAREAERYRIAADVVDAEERTAGRRRGTSPDPRHSSTHMARQVILSDPKEWTVQELLDEMLAQGWQSDAVNQLNTVRTAISRVASQDAEIVRTATGRYRRRHDPEYVENVHGATVAMIEDTGSPIDP